MAAGDTGKTIHPGIQSAIESVRVEARADVDHARGECQRRHDRTNGTVIEVKGIALEARGIAEANVRRLITIAGEDGKGGRCEVHRSDLSSIKGELEKHRTLWIKLSIAVVAASLIGGGIGQAVLKALGSSVP